MSVDETITFSLAVKNTGNRERQEIVQLYIRDIKSSLPRPVKELKRFKKVKLMPGEEKIVSLSIDKEALSFFDAEKHEWICEPGKFEAIIAASAMDIKDVLKFELNKDRSHDETFNPCIRIFILALSSLLEWRFGNFFRTPG